MQQNLNDMMQLLNVHSGAIVLLFLEGFLVLSLASQMHIKTSSETWRNNTKQQTEIPWNHLKLFSTNQVQSLYVGQRDILQGWLPGKAGDPALLGSRAPCQSSGVQSQREPFNYSVRKPPTSLLTGGNAPGSQTQALRPAFQLQRSSDWQQDP